MNYSQEIYLEGEKMLVDEWPEYKLIYTAKEEIIDVSKKEEPKEPQKKEEIKVQPDKIPEKKDKGEIQKMDKKDPKYVDLIDSF